MKYTEESCSGLQDVGRGDQQRLGDQRALRPQPRQRPRHPRPRGPGQQTRENILHKL